MKENFGKRVVDYIRIIELCESKPGELGQRTRAIINKVVCIFKPIPKPASKQ
jgi:hypothetical protein